jgi:hypothetical protein
MTRQNKKFTDAFNEFDDMSELVDAFIDRVDLVGKAANGHSFILAKSDSTNMLPADLVRDLIAKANEEIMPEQTEEVAKADLDANTILADIDVSGDVEEIGSAAWEAVDAATAAKWAAILGRAMTAICELRDREKMEQEELGEDNYNEIAGLGDAVEAIKFAISVLAPFAVHEAVESEEASGDLMKSEDALETLEKAGRSLSTANEIALRSASEAIQKVLDSLPAPVKEEVVAGEAVAKKSRIEEIVDIAVADVEVEKSDDKDDVEIAVPVDEIEKAGVDAAMSDDELARLALTGADSERKEALQEIGLRALTSHMKHETSETPVEEVVEEAAEDEAEVADDVAEIEDMPVEDEAVTEELTPAPADEVGTPAGEVTKSVEVELDGAKMVEKLVKEALDSQSEGYLEVIKSLEDRIATLEAPAPSRVLTNGALPPAHLMRGQDAGASLMSDATALRKQMDDAPDAVTKAEAGENMRIAALDALTALRNR